MKRILKTVIAVLILLGVVKTVQTHDVINEADQYYQQMKNGQLLENFSNYDINQLKDIDIKQFSPSDFFQILNKPMTHINDNTSESAVNIDD